jgi:nitroimidazol reductase NimA-like FMN-containing flavoprotein (pyridoxamine 5'-phosphate oxidase superfamily)
MQTMVQLTRAECSALLASGRVGRIGFVVEGDPLVIPVNYRWIDHGDEAYVALRTRPDNIVDRAGPRVAFEVDGIDDLHHAGWSVLVQGTLHHLGDAPAARELLDPQPWLGSERDSWLLIAVRSVSGRRLTAAESQWAFHIRGYL